MKIFRDLVAPGYFDLMKIPLLEGRDFDLRDDAGSQPVMIVSQAFVRQFLPSQDPIGRKVHGWGKWFTIVGVAGDIKVHSFLENPKPYFYVPIRQVYRPEMGVTFHVRTRGSVNSALAAIGRDAGGIDRTLPVFNAMPLTEFISAALFGQKIAANLLSVLGGVALVLAAVGLYGVMAYTVVQRTNEIGIRMALGAQHNDVIGLVLREGMGYAAVGFCAGTLVAAGLARLAKAWLTGVSPADPASYALVALFTVTVALVSTAIPAWRAQRVDPIEALRVNC
jgi:predicted permease